jgi:diguanylate cyclase (GGDEF)-like protein
VNVLIVISAVLGACVVLLLALLWATARRSRRVEEERRRSRSLAEIATSLDLDEVLARTLEEAARLVGADAAVLRMDAAAGEDGEPLVASLGLPRDEAERLAAAAAPHNGGLSVPLGGGDPVGSLTVHARDPQHRFDAGDAQRLGELAGQAAPAIENARRFREARRLADVDALTGLHNRRYFHETLAREVARAQRYSRRLSLIVFDLDDFKAVNDRIGHLGGDAVLAEAAQRVRTVVRRADVPCRVGGDEFAVIMPESGLEQAEQLFGRLQQAISAGPIAHIGRLSISAGVAELRPDDLSFSLFERADAALYVAKSSGKGRAATTGPAASG